jgi:hypothetical protein
MVGKDGEAKVSRDTFVALSRALGAKVCLDDACTRFSQSGDSVRVKLKDGKVLRIHFMPHNTDSFFYPKDVYMLYFDIQ